MQIVGTEHQTDIVGGVVTIDVWYSARRQAWIVERLDAQGSLIGASFCCEEEADAVECVATWLRCHSETQFVAPRDLARAIRRTFKRRPQRHAA